MKTIKILGQALRRGPFIALALLALLPLDLRFSTAFAQGTAFTYQGQLSANGSPANGTYDLRLFLFPALTGGSQLGTTQTNLGVGVTNGLFTLTVDFGPVFTGTSNWLRIDVRTNGGSFTTLVPRQPVTPTPYAIFADAASTASTVSGTITTAQISGVVASANLSGTYGNALNLNNAGNSFSGNGGGLTNLNASQLIGGTVPDAQLSGNVALLAANQTFTGVNKFTGSNQSIIINGNGPAGTNIFTGLGLYYDNNTGEGDIMSSFNDIYASLNFYTKPGPGFPTTKQVKIDRYGTLMIDQQNANYGALNDGTTNGAGLVFGTGGGEGIASQRTAGVNKNGLDFYTSNSRQMSILNNGNVGMGTTNPSTALQVIGTVTATSFSGNGSGLTNLNANNLTNGTIPLARLPGAVVTNNEPNVALSNLTVNGSLNLPATATINSGGSTLLYDDGSGNFFAGQNAGNLPASAPDNTAIGANSLINNTTGSNNVAVGFQAIRNNTTGSNNVAEGYQAMRNNTTGYNNTAVGGGAMFSDTSGTYNAAFGWHALNAMTIGVFNVAIGEEALASSSGSGYNVAVGGEALFSDTGGTANTAVGNQALSGNTIASANTGVGFQALTSTTTGSGNVAVGCLALNDNVGGSNNVASGGSALYANTSGSQNVAIGASALENSTSDNGLVAIGYQALQNDNALGYGFTGNGENTAVGYSALQFDTIGSGNTAMGYQALQETTTGYDNSAFGDYALQTNKTGAANTAFGFGALYNLTSGVANIAIGFGAGQYLTTESNNIYIGNFGVPGDYGAIRIGDPNYQTKDTLIAGIYGTTLPGGQGVPVYVDAGGHLGTMMSSRRYKQDIQSMADTSEALYSLRPVSFKYKRDLDPQGAPQFGLIAEEVEQVDPDLVAHDGTGKIYSVRYEAVNAMLLNEFLKQHRKVEQQNTAIESLKAKAAKVEVLEKQNDLLAARLNELEATVKALAAKK